MMVAAGEPAVPEAYLSVSQGYLTGKASFIQHEKLVNLKK